jgi:hypothetical protein
MKKLELEEYQAYFVSRFKSEKDKDVLKYVQELYQSFSEKDFESFIGFKGTVDGLIHDFKKKHNKYPTAQFDSNNFKNNKVQEITYKKKQTIEKPDYENYEKIETLGSKQICLVINSFDQLIDAMKCILWSLNNEPSTSAKIFQHILISKDNKEIPITREDYDLYTNSLINKATRDGRLYVQKKLINGKTIWFYSNPTKKRYGYYLDGKLRTLRQIEKFYDIPFTTLHSRLKKMNIEQAVKK